MLSLPLGRPSFGLKGLGDKLPPIGETVVSTDAVYLGYPTSVRFREREKKYTHLYSLAVIYISKRRIHIVEVAKLTDSLHILHLLN